MAFDPVRGYVVLASIGQRTWALPSRAGSGIFREPANRAVRPGETCSLSILAYGADPLTYRWRRGGIELSDGPTGHGSVISGATTATLSITGCAELDEGSYECIVSTVCGSVTSAAGVLTVLCTADFNADGMTMSQDFFDYVTAFFLGLLSADVDVDGVVTSEDFFGFLEAFLAGC
jgi:hypothetical protein